MNSTDSKFLVLINAGAGSAAKGQLSDPCSLIKRALQEHGVSAELRSLPGAEIAAAVKAFAESHSHRTSRDEVALVVAGGDGTISAAAGVLAGTTVPLGIIPFGTLNHFAKDLSLPLEIEGAIQVIAAGKTIQVDVAELNGRVFVNNSSVGLYPFMVARRNEHQRRHGVGKFVAMVPAIAETLLGASWRRLRITAAGERHTVRTPCVFVGNNTYQMGGSNLGTRTSLSRGELDVHVIKQQTRLGLLLLPFKVACQLADPTRDVQTFKTADLEITSRLTNLQVSFDGEITAVKTPLRYRSRPGALRVFAA